MLTLDFSSPWQFGFQDPATPIMEGLISLHHHIFFFLIIIFIFVVWIILNTLYYYSYNETIFLKKLYKNSKFLFLTQYLNLIFKINKQKHHTFLEIIWTIIPSFVLIFIAIPSFSLLYCMDEVLNPVITLKIMGRQWYWCYEYVLTMHRRYTEDHIKKAVLVDFASYLVPTDELTTPGNFRLLEVDNRIVLPIKTHIRLLISSGDVLHAWAVPSMGVKMDAVPGRLNQALLFIKRPGLFYGQCSELCGINHGFMPIVVQAVSYNDFLTWYHAKLLNA